MATTAAKPQIPPQFKPTAALVTFLANRLIAERARVLRLESYLTDVLDAEPPGELPVTGLEGADWEAYWEYTARMTLSDEEGRDWQRDYDLSELSPKSQDDAALFTPFPRENEIGGPPSLGHGIVTTEQVDRVAAFIQRAARKQGR